MAKKKPPKRIAKLARKGAKSVEEAEGPVPRVEEPAGRAAEPAGKVEILSPLASATLSSPLAIVRVRYEGASARTAEISVGAVKHVVEIASAAGEVRENVTLLEGRNEIRATVGGASHVIAVEVRPSRNITILRPEALASIATRATEFAGSFEGASCPAGVIAVNGFMQQFAVGGAGGTFAEQVVLRPGPNHLAIQIGEYYATRLVSGAFPAAKLLVTLVWDTNLTDVDLYVTEPTGGSVWYRNKSLPGGGNLDVDRTQGYGPENYSNGAAGASIAPGRYRVRVHFYADRDVGRTEWTTRVIADEGAGAQQRRTFYGILDRSASGNALPSATGPDWNEVCMIDVSANGDVTFAGPG